MPTQAEQEAIWKAESGAHALAEAVVIKKDAKRLKAAQIAAKRLAKESQVRAEGFRVIQSNL